MTSERYQEFENENSYRNYPFSETASMEDRDASALATDVFVDAFLYPVVDSYAVPLLKLLDFSKGGLVEISVGDGTISGSFSGGSVELYDGLGRHAGTLVCGPGWGREASAMRVREFDGVEFASSAVSVIVHPGVHSFDVGNGSRTTRKFVEFVGDGCITPVLENKDTGPELSFDVQNDELPTDTLYVRQLLFVAVGRTVFDISEQSEDTVLLTTPTMDREDVCWQAHQEDAVSTVVDTCDDSNDEPPCPSVPPPFKLEEIWMCPSQVGDINLVAEDILGLKNSVHVVPVEGRMSVSSPRILPEMDADAMVNEASKMLKRPVQIGNGIKISIPGLSNGR